MSLAPSREIDEVSLDVIRTLRASSDPARVRKASVYFSTSMEVAGVANPELRRLIGKLRSRYRNWEEQDWIALCKNLVAEKVFEAQIMAFEILAGNRKLLGHLGLSDLDGLMLRLDNWASVDHFAVGVYGVLWRIGTVTDGHLDTLLSSDDPWQRRVAVVATVALNQRSRGGTGDTGRTLYVCEKVAGDPHPMVRKALSWALRELSKRDPSAVSDFTETHRHDLANFIIREVTHKLRFGTKN